MKTSHFYAAVGLCSVLGCFSSQAAIYTQNTFNDGQNQTSPDYADFTSSDLTTSYSYASGTGIGTLTVTGGGTTAETYQAGSAAAGTHGQDNKTFDGSFALHATVKFNATDNQWEIQSGGTVTVEGDLLGGTTSSVLLSANLRSGIDTLNVNSANDFEFLFYANSSSNPTILEDFFGTQDQGAIILNPGTTSYSNFTTTWAGTIGQANTFVPEPSVYAGFSSIFALLGLVSTVRKNRRKESVV